ncbi:MAG: GntR family transcriptional regulator [Chitinivibrionales bacterium]|nr:GntR family transcriptional regulator [Chitinivibrionales bacterium]
MNCRAPGISKAIACVIKHIKTDQLDTGQTLPSIEKLARMSSVSIRTMHKAMRILKKEQIVDCMHGRPTRLLAGCRDEDVLSALLHVTAIPESGENPPARASAWQRIAHDIREKVHARKFDPPVGFPSNKELQHSYNASYQTIKKALLSLCEEQILAPSGGSFRPATISRGKVDSEIVYFPLTNIKQQLIMSDNASRGFEHECHYNGIRSRFVGSLLSRNELLFVDNKKTGPVLNDSEKVLGYILPVTMPDDTWMKVLRTIVHFNKPIALIDHLGGWSLPAWASPRNTRVFHARSHRRCGKIAARYALEKGHAAVGYISPFHQARWSRERFAAIQVTFNQFGMSSSPFQFTFERSPIISTYHEQARTHCAFSRFEKFYKQWRPNLPDAYAPHFDYLVYEQIPFDLLSRLELFHDVRNLFEAALKQREISAWICANDIVGIAALDFLKQRGIDVPGQISVIAFDDTVEASTYDLSSYNFNIEAIIRAAIGFIINRDTFPSRRPVEFDGILIERGSG